MVLWVVGPGAFGAAPGIEVVGLVDVVKLRRELERLGERLLDRYHERQHDPPDLLQIVLARPTEIPDLVEDLPLSDRHCA